MLKAIKNFEQELSAIRAGRANPHMLDKIHVDYYGTNTPIKQIANINIPDAFTIIVQPWDINMLTPIQKAIQVSDLGINPVLDSKILRISLPPLTQERRVFLTKDIKKKCEDSKVSLRNIRRDSLDVLKKSHKANKISEDELKLQEDKVQKLIDKYALELDKLTEDKIKDVMTV